jgi:hypothetical protein
MKYFFYVSAIVILLLNNRNASASHAYGGEITYKCLGANQYEITLTFYRDCFGISAPASMNLDVTNTCGFPAQTVNLPPVGPPLIIHTTCSTVLNSCSGGVYNGLQKWTYMNTVTLPGSCVEWTFSHAESARSNSITTLYSVSDILFLYATLNNTDSLCNSSPFFVLDAVDYGYTGLPVCLNNICVDVDNDSLVYELVMPKTGLLVSDTVWFNNGYTFLSPVLSTAGFVADSDNGSICFTPVQSEVGVYAMKVSEYRNGILIGSVVRDIELEIRNANNNIPTVSGFNCFPFTTKYVCAGVQTCFKICTIDNDSANITYLSYFTNYPNITFTTTGTQRDTAEICITPALADTALAPVLVTAYVHDDNCPYFGATSRNLYFDVIYDSTCITTAISSLTDLDFDVYHSAGSSTIGISSNDNACQLKVSDLSGRIIHSEKLFSSQTEINLVNISSGLYFITMTNEKMQRVVKKIFIY